MPPVQRFMDRLDIDSELRYQVMDEDFVQTARSKFFPEMTLDSLIEDLLAIYRSENNPLSGVCAVWSRIDNEVPLSTEEYMDLTEVLTTRIDEEPNPPSQADWDNLDEVLMK